MTDLIVGLGLVLVIEGLLWAAFPSAGRQLLEMAAKAPEPSVRLAGAVSVLLGVIVVWLGRG